MLELIQVPGMSMPRVAALHQGLGIATVADLRAAYEIGRVRRVKGFDAKTEEKILAGIRQCDYVMRYPPALSPLSRPDTGASFRLAGGLLVEAEQRHLPVVSENSSHARAQAARW